MDALPTSAELAAFRQSLGDAAPRGTLAWRAVRGGLSTAFQDEREHGIGHTAGPRGNVIFRAWDPATEARRGAAAMRHLAWVTAPTFHEER